MGFGEAISVCFSKYVEFSGRAARSEYWFWTLFTVLASLGFTLAEMVGGIVVSVLSMVFSLATFLPTLAVQARRLHDIDRSAWWMLLVFVPIIGWVVLLVFDCLRGTDGPNRFGLPTTPGWARYRGVAA